MRNPLKNIDRMTTVQRLIFVVCPAMVIVLVWVLYNLFNWSIVRGEEMEGRAARQQLSDTTISAARGTIYDTNMNVLAQSATAWNIIIDPKTIEDNIPDTEKTEAGDIPVDKDVYRKNFAQRLADVLGKDPDYILEQMSYTNRNYRKVADRVDKTTVTTLQEMLKEYGYVGVTTEVSTKRYYP